MGDEGGFPQAAWNPCRTGENRRTWRIARFIHQKIEDHESYAFTKAEVRLITVFFDLAQQFWDSEDFYALCVLLPKVFFEQDSDLYMLDDEGALLLAASCGCLADGRAPQPVDIPALPEAPRLVGAEFFVPLKGNRELLDMLRFKPPNAVIGCLVVHGAAQLSDHERLFYEKYANRIGFQLHIRMIREKNIEQLEFIRNLVGDIGHNVIVPNMYFRLFFNRLKARIDELEALGRDLKAAAGPAHAPEPLARLGGIHDAILTQFNEIFRHYEQTSLFLETLLRRRHFEEGRYVLERRVCNLRKQVVEPQVERHRSRLEERGIHIDMTLGGVPDQMIYLNADLGLISQVYANLFSNAVKYTDEATLADGRRGKFMAYGWEVQKDRFGPGHDGVKLNVFTSGRPIPEEDQKKLFTPGFRGRNVQAEEGTGHGLYFVRQVVELHGGEVGYEPKPDGNNFYVILPMEPEAPGGAACDLPPGKATPQPG